MATQYQTRAQVASRAGESARMDEGLRSYMLRVYNYMGSGLALSGAIAAYVASSPSLMQAIFGSGLGMVAMLAPIAIIFAMSFGVNRFGTTTLQALYWVFVALMGLSLAMVFAVYTAESITRVFFITAGTFGAMSLFGYTTKRDLSGMGSFLIMGLIGIVIASVVNIFLASSMLQFVVSVLGVLIFTGLTAYDTQRIKSQYYHGHSDEILQKSAIMGALSLYLNFYNLFIMLMHLFGNRE